MFERLEARTFFSAGATALPATARISGVVYDDRNANATHDTGDAALAGVKVFVDLKHTGAFASGDPYALTNSSGAYTLAQLKSGTYQIGQVLPPHFRQVFPFGGAERAITVTAGDVITKQDFADTTTSRVSGFVFVNLSSQGTSAGKTGISGVKVWVTPTGGKGPVYATYTNSVGYFVVGALPHAAYVVTFQPPQGYTLVTGTLSRTTAYLGLGQTADNIVFLGKLAAPIVYNSQDRFTSAAVQIDQNDYPNPGYPTMVQSASGLGAFNASVMSSKDTGSIIVDGTPDDISVQAAATQKSALTTAELTATGSTSAAESDTSSGGQSIATAESHFQTTFTVYAPLKYNLNALIGMDGGGNSVLFTFDGPKGSVLTPAGNVTGDRYVQTGTLTPGVYTIKYDLVSVDADQNRPQAAYSIDLKFG